MSYEWREHAPVGARTESTREMVRESDRAEAVARSCEALFARQAPEGFWCGELTADATLESDFILLQLWMHQPEGDEWDPPSRHRIAKAALSILERQLPHGGFNIYGGGPAELNATIKAYCALKLAGHSVDSDPLRRARNCILDLGGLQGANSYVKINLSLFGLYPRQHAPSVPPEIVLLPGNVLYEMSSWTRSILVPLSIVQARGSNRRAPAGFSLDELLLPSGVIAMGPVSALTLRLIFLPALLVVVLIGISVCGPVKPPPEPTYAVTPAGAHVRVAVAAAPGAPGKATALSAPTAVTAHTARVIDANIPGLLTQDLDRAVPGTLIRSRPPPVQRQSRPLTCSRTRGLASRHSDAPPQA